MVVAQSGLMLTSERLMLFMAAAGLIGGLAAGAARQSILVGVAGAGVVGMFPFLYVLWVRNSRMEKLNSQLPDAFELMARVIRAGQTMTQGLQAVSLEFDQPIAGEFSYCYEQQNLGLSPELRFAIWVAEPDCWKSRFLSLHCLYSSPAVAISLSCSTNFRESFAIAIVSGARYER